MRNLKRALSILLAIAIVSLANISAISEVAAFSDVANNAWYYRYVNRLVSLKITAGIGNNKYGPNNSVTKAEFVTFLCKANGLTQTEGYTFTDTQNHWSGKWLSTAVAANFIDKNTAFYPNKAITRQEAVEMLCRSINLEESTVITSPYSDVKTDMGYSNKAFEEYLMLGSVINGQRYFYPLNNIKRSEVAAVIVNLVDYKADAKIYKAAKIAELEQKEQQAREEKAEAERYAAWKESVKDISPELLNNTQGLYKGSVYESYKILRTEEIIFLKNWGEKYNMTPEEFEKEMVRVGVEYGNMWADVNYKKIDVFINKLNMYWAKYGVITTIYQSNVDYVMNNTIVSDGEFIANEGTLIFSDSIGNPVLIGTMKYKYSNPTSPQLLNSEIISSTGKPSKIGVWYEQDYLITFSPEIDALKVNGCRSISGIRILK